MTESEMKEPGPGHQASAMASDAVEARAVLQVVAKPHAAPPCFSGVCKAGGKGASPAKGPVPFAPCPGFSGVFKSGPLEPAARPAAAPKATASAQRPERAQGILNYVYVEFDQTISKIHVFKQLAAWELGVDAPQAMSLHGQIHRLTAATPGSFWTAVCFGRTRACGAAEQLLFELKGVRSMADHHHEGQRAPPPIPPGARRLAAVLRAGLRDVLRRVRLRSANSEPSSLKGSSDCELRESKANLIRCFMSLEPWLWTKRTTPRRLA
ncbi:unnamed protein product [Symbiodinium sp. KB8]|nr:unnamed protein product [Symbiodinium sp. KB8]